jgi:hypothetical protein
MEWEIYAARGGHVCAQFVLESMARDFARWRNDGRRIWRVRPISDATRLPDISTQ